MGARQDSTLNLRQSFCNYLHSEIEYLEERDFLTFRNETVELLSGIQYKAAECKRQVSTTQQTPVTTFQVPQQPHATTGREYILTIPETQQVLTQGVQTSQVAAKLQPQRSLQSSSSLSKPASFTVVDDQQPGPSRKLTFALIPTKIFNLPLVTYIQVEESQHNTSGLSTLFRNIPSQLQYQQINTPQPYSPSQLQPAPSPVPTSTQQESARPLSQSSPQSHPMSAD